MRAGIIEVMAMVLPAGRGYWRVRSTAVLAVLAGLAVLGSAACYVDEPLEAPQPREEPAHPSESEAEAEAEPDPDGGMSALIDEVRRADAEQTAVQANRAALEAEADALPEEVRMQEAKERFSEGLEAYERGDYELARDRFFEAYVFAPDKHALAFNVAKAAERAGSCCMAREYYQRFLDRQSAGHVHVPVNVEERLAALRCEACPDPL